jgi:hypothetical protein
VPRHGPVLDLGGTLADHHHRRLEPLAALVGPAVRFAHGAPGAQTPGQLATQLAPALDIKGLIDRLVRHVHLRLIGEPQPQPPADLFRAPSSTQSAGDLLPKPRVQSQLARLRSRAAPRRAAMGSPGPVTDLARHSPDDLAAVAAELNGRPRKTLGWKTPAERLAALLQF